MKKKPKTQACDTDSREQTPDIINNPNKPHSRNWAGHWKKTPGRLLGVGLIRVYQLTLSGFVGNSCRHQPTCSEYGYEAIARYGLFRGGWLTVIRIAKCNPWGTSGFDPVPKK